MSNVLGTREQSVIIALHHALITPGFHHFYNHQPAPLEIRNILIHFFTIDSTYKYACYIGKKVDNFSTNEITKESSEFLIDIAAMSHKAKEFIQQASFVWIEYEEKFEQQSWYLELVILLQQIMKEKPIPILCFS